MPFEEEDSGGDHGTAPNERTVTWDDLLDPEVPDDIEADVKDEMLDVEAVDGVKADVRMFSGCKDLQKSADVYDVTSFGVPSVASTTGTAGGACTNALLLNVKDHKPDSWMSLLKDMRATLKTKKFKQIPQLAASSKLDIHSPFSLAGDERGEHRALLIGINYAGAGLEELKGCHNDVEQMREYIVEHGYPAEGPGLKILMDDGKSESPTRANILKAIKWLVEGAKPGDSLFMHFSGHGGSVMDYSGDEKDQMDETMFPVDFVMSGQIKDDELFAELVSPLPEGVVLSVVMDCCHSGSALDLPYYFDANDDALRLVDAGGSGAMLKKTNFKPNKVPKVQGKIGAAATSTSSATQPLPPRVSQDQGIGAKKQPAGRPDWSTRGRVPDYKLSIETQVLKCMETGGYVAPEPRAFKNFASCEGDVKTDVEDDCDLAMFVVTQEATHEETGHHQPAGISMVWVDSESATGYSMKHVTEGDARFAGKRAVYIEATKGEGNSAFLVAVFAPDDFDPNMKSGAAPRSTTFMVWVCNEMLLSSSGKPAWTACGSFVGTKVKKTSATNSPSGEHLVIIEALDSNNEERVFYGTSLGNEDLQMSTFPKPRAMATTEKQVSSVQVSTLEKDGKAFPIALTLPMRHADEKGVVSGTPTLFAQSLEGPALYAGTIDIPGDTRCFVSAPADGLKSDVFLAGAKKLTWYDDEPWKVGPHDEGAGNKVEGVQLNEMDFPAPAKQMRTVIDKQYIRHVFVLLEDGKLLYTSQDPANGSKFDEPVDILPSVADFSCHVDSMGNVHVNNLNKNGHLMHHMMDNGAGTWMQKEVMVPGGAPTEHIISVVDLKVEAIVQERGGENAGGPYVEDFVRVSQMPLPAMSVSCPAAAVVRINGKGHLMHTDKAVEVTPSATGSVRLGQFVDSFSVPRVQVRMEGLDRPLEILCGKILHQKLDKMDATDLKGAKARDSTGNESGSLITDPDDLEHTEGFMDSVHKFVKGFEVLYPTDFAKPDERDGNFRLVGRALAPENQFVAYADESVSPDTDDEKESVSPNTEEKESVPPTTNEEKENVPSIILTMPELPPDRGVATQRSSKVVAPGVGRRKLGRSVIRRFKKHHLTPHPFGMGHHPVARGRHRVECRGMGNIAKMAKENADEAIFKAKKLAARVCKVKVANAERAHERATLYHKDATKWAAENQQAIEAVKWTHECYEAAQSVVTALENEIATGGIQPVEDNHAHQTLDPEALTALGAASKAIQVAAAAKEKSYQARVRSAGASAQLDAVLEVDDGLDAGGDDVDADGGGDADTNGGGHADAEDGGDADDGDGDDIDEFGPRGYSDRSVWGSFKKLTHSIKKTAEKAGHAITNAGKATLKAAEDTAKAAKKELEHANKIAKDLAKKAAAEALAAKREMEKIARAAARKAEAAAKATKREAEKAARLVQEAAHEAKKAAEHAEKELAAAAKKAADGAKHAAEEAAKLAEEAAKAVKEGVEEVADDVRDGVVDAVEELEDVAVHIKDEVEDTVKDVVGVVEDVTIAIVDVVEDVAEEVWENTKDGVILVSRKVVKVAKKAVDFAVKVGNAVYHVVETAYEQLVKGLDWLWTQIKTGINAALEFLAEFFGLAEIIKTADLLQDSVVAGMDMLIAAIPTEKDVKNLFNNIRLDLEQATGLDLDSQEVGNASTEKASERDLDPKENFVSHHAASGTFKTSTTVVKDAQEDHVGGEEEEGLGTKLEEAFHTFQKTGSLNKLLSVLLDGVLDMLEGATVSTMKTLGSLGEAFRDWIAGGGEIYIPIVSEMYMLATGGHKLKFGKVVFFMLAIPFTYTCKGIMGKWPSQIISRKHLSRASLGAHSDPSVTETAPVSTTVSTRSSTESGSRGDDDWRYALTLAGLSCSFSGSLLAAAQSTIMASPNYGKYWPAVLSPAPWKAISVLLGIVARKKPVGTRDIAEAWFFSAVAFGGPAMGTMAVARKLKSGWSPPNGFKYTVVVLKFASRMCNIYKGIRVAVEGSPLYGTHAILSGVTGAMVSVVEFMLVMKQPIDLRYLAVAYFSNALVISMGIPLAQIRHTNGNAFDVFEV